MSTGQDEPVRLNGRPTDYTVEHLELIRTLWFEGVSASQIAGRLSRLRGRTSRNAIIGVVSRRGWQRTPEAREATQRLCHVNAGRQKKTEGDANSQQLAEVNALRNKVARIKTAPTTPRVEQQKLVSGRRKLETKPVVDTTPALLPTVEVGQCRYETKPGLFCARATEIRRGRRASYCDICAPRIFVKGGRL